MRLTDGANGYVTADAVRIVSGLGVPQVVEMDVAGYEHSIADGDTSPSLDDATDFGTVPATSNSVVHTFTILNTGNATLHLTGSPRVQISGDDAQDFTVVREPDFSVAPGGTTSFDVMFHPTDTGLRQATISLVDDDTSEPLYDFAVQGTGGTPGPLQVTIDDSGGGFLSVGEWASNPNSLAYQGGVRTSAAGSGNDRASWTFVGLAPGQYEAFATWVPFGNRATNAPFTVSNGDTTTYTTQVNQQQSAAAGNGTSLGTIAVTNGLLVVTLNDNANGYVVADSVTVVRQGVVPNVQPVVLLAHNAVMPQDVNADGLVSPLDALLVINSLLDAGSAGSGTSGISPQAATPSTSSASNATQYFLDVNGDGTVSPIDALLVINSLLDPAPQPAAATSSADDSSGSVAPQAATSSTADFPAVMAAVAVDQAMHQMSDSVDSDGATSIDPATVSELASVGAADSANAVLLTPALVQWSFAEDAGDAQEEDELDAALFAI